MLGPLIPIRKGSSGSGAEPRLRLPTSYPVWHRTRIGMIDVFPMPNIAGRCILIRAQSDSRCLVGGLNLAGIKGVVVDAVQCDLKHLEMSLNGSFYPYL